MTLDAEYVQAVKDATGYWGSSPPNLRVRPGTIGIVENGIFSPQDHLENIQGVNPEALRLDDQESPPNTIVRMSNRVRWSTIKAKGAAPIGSVPVGAKVSVKFEADRQVVVACSAARVRNFARLALVRDEVRKLDDLDKWQKGWAFVTDVYETDHLRILFSSKTGGNVLLEVSALIPAPIAGGSTIFASPGIKFGAGTNSHGVETDEIEATCTPLFHASIFRRWAHIPGTKGLRPLGPEDQFPEPPLGLAQLGDVADDD
jgi:hypothetical protein